MQPIDPVSLYTVEFRESIADYKYTPDFPESAMFAGRYVDPGSFIMGRTWKLGCPGDIWVTGALVILF